MLHEVVLSILRSLLILGILNAARALVVLLSLVSGLNLLDWFALRNAPMTVLTSGCLEAPKDPVPFILSTLVTMF